MRQNAFYRLVSWFAAGRKAAKQNRAQTLCSLPPDPLIGWAVFAHRGQLMCNERLLQWLRDVVKLVSSDFVSDSFLFGGLHYVLRNGPDVLVARLLGQRQTKTHRDSVK